MALLSEAEAEAQFVRNRDSALTFLRVLRANLGNLDVLRLAHNQLRETASLGFRKGLSAELILQVLRMQRSWEANKRLFPLLRRQPSHKSRVTLLDDAGNEMEDDQTHEDLATFLQLQQNIEETFSAWDAFMIQAQTPLPPPESPEVVRLEDHPKQFVGERDRALYLRSQEPGRVKELGPLEHEQAVLERLVDLGCRKGLSADIIKQMLAIEEARARNKKYFERLLRYSSYETTQEVAAAERRTPQSPFAQQYKHTLATIASLSQQAKERSTPLMAERASGFARERGVRPECVVCMVDSGAEIKLKPITCKNPHRDKICAGCLAEADNCPICMGLLGE